MNPLVEPPAAAVSEAVARALAEDLVPLGDITSALLAPTATARGALVSRAPGRLAGTACVVETCRQVDERLVVDLRLHDGASLEPGAVIGTIEGPLAAMLTAERTALNFLGHLSGVATLAARYREAADESTLVWDTRKTTPGLRALEKAAVRAGGGANHRGNLSEWVMLKDNHLVGVDLTDVVHRALEAWPGRTVHVECDTYEQALEAAAAGAHAVLLDNMAPDEVTRCVAALREQHGRHVWIEVSGGVTLDNVAEYGRTGADLISSGALTASAPVLDIGLDLREVTP